LTNRFVTAGTTFQYDLNGNLVQDQEGRQFTFNGDNKQSVVKDSNGNKIGEYFYDGEGRRVKKLVYDPNGVLQETTVFVYSSGKLVAEYSTAAPSPQPTTNYTATDMLGSPRVLTDSLGNVVSRRDFLPFGEELYADGVHRSVEGKYSQSGQDGVRQRFTGYQKDAETSLDFAEARMYANTYGRFTAVDPLLASGKSANPQTFNRYVYVLNNPLLLTDPTGLQTGFWFGRPGDRPRYIEKGKPVPSGFTPVQKDALGRLAYTADGMHPSQAVILNPMGPGVWPNKKEFVEDMLAGPINMRTWYAAGFKIDLSAEFLASTPEPVVGVRDASLSFYFSILPLAQTGKAALEGAILTKGAGEALAGSIRNVNPTGGSFNCVNCAIATDATLAGRSASAMPGSATPITELETTFGGKFAPATQSEITDALIGAGSGSRGIVFGDLGRGRAGHVWNAVNQNGIVRYLDGQSGGKAVMEGYKGLRFLWTNPPGQ